ncbi:hypothetical protein ACGFYV_18095, partial [Streptomyces sp. NPDC048297]
MPFAEAMTPVRMRRVAVIVPQVALPDALVRIAEAGCVELDRAEEAPAGAAAVRLQRLRGGVMTAGPEGTTSAEPEGTTSAGPEGATSAEPGSTAPPRPESTTSTEPESTAPPRPESTTSTEPD